jgi:hypothetical protein
MAEEFNAHAVCIGLLAASLTLGCEQSPTVPTPTPPPPTPLSLEAITPNSGSSTIPLSVTIRGAGFLPGATVTVGAAATEVTVVDSTTIRALTQPHETGPVDVIVTNPAGDSARLAAAFTYFEQPYTITASTSSVAAGARLSVSWAVPGAGPLDWVGFFLVTESSYEYEYRWWQYTDGSNSGTIELTAPAMPGRYEFRYLKDDGFTDVARSAPVTVTP